ncbi:MAG: hypothetical protein ACRC33_22140 [Gemmataceae bacterium]
MKRLLLSLVAGLLAAGAAAALPLELLGLPGPTDVISAIDYLTKRDSKTTVDVKAGKVTSAGKLLVGRLKVDVKMERSSKNWRGQVTSTVVVPTEISYAVDLADLKPHHVRIDAQERALVVVMPTPRVEAVTPLLSDVKKDTGFKGARFKLFDSHTGTELQHAMLLHDYQARAKTVGEGHAAKVRAEGRERFRELLEALLGRAFRGLSFRVE